MNKESLSKKIHKASTKHRENVNLGELIDSLLHGNAAQKLLAGLINKEMLKYEHVSRSTFARSFVGIMLRGGV